ncbi:MAG: hypothetical protein Q4E27_07690 [Bacteroidales bacterium]|nr:hypothetical protein [Bacteroidales bacterium]
MTVEIEMALRLLAAGFLGAVIGYEREQPASTLRASRPSATR